MREENNGEILTEEALCNMCILNDIMCISEERERRSQENG